MERCRLSDLPLPPPGKTGWPWTVETPSLPPVCLDGTLWPRISIVTPSHNQGRFIEETIRSVLLQGYPELEYIIVDGGSTDESLDIIRRYEKWLTHWVSEEDGGQVDALSKGFRCLNGEYLNWLNSDDYLLPNALKTIACITRIAPECDFISGTRFFSTVEGEVLSLQSAQFDLPFCIAGFPDFPQDSTFFSRKIWEKIGGLDDRFTYSFDTAFYAMGLRLSASFALTSAPISVMHVYAAQKSNRHDPKKNTEENLLKKEYMPRGLRARFISQLSKTRFHPWAKVLSSLVFPNGQSTFARVEFDYMSGLWKRIT